MNSKVINIDAGEVLREHILLSVKITGISDFMIRSKIGLWIIRFGCWILGIPTEVELKAS